MPIIRPLSDLRKHSNEISEQCRESAEPVFITRKGRSDLVVMSHALYEQREARLELYAKLAEAERAHQRGDRGVTHVDLMKKLRRRIG
jgi:prevent-host-death family protein